MEQGIQAVKEGNLGEGARLLRIALADANLNPAMRATIHIWLAETQPENAFKINCYQDALAAEPTNVHAQQRLTALLTADLPPINNPAFSSVTMPSNPTPTVPQVQPVPLTSALPYAPHSPATATSTSEQRAVPREIAVFYRTVGIIDGKHGAGTGFFITQDGVIATTRLVVSGLENVTIALESGRQLIGKVMRSYADVDLAFIQVELNLTHLLPFTSMAAMPDNLELTAVVHNGGMLWGRVRPTRRDIKPHWIPTTIRQLSDVGGNPVHDDRNNVVGMLTRNASRSSEDVFALHIHTIQRLYEEHKRDMQLDPHRTYCPNCGYISRAPNFHAFYCEACGSVLPPARALQRLPLPNTATLYGENLQRPCRHCTTRVGYYNGRCLRCGGDF
jgi:S1-C subfamily serine protease